jgi:hypothetical protein
MNSMSDPPPVIDYHNPTAPVTPTATSGVVIAFILSTLCASIVLFTSVPAVRLARPGSRLFGPQDQYVHEVHKVAVVSYAAAMCVIGGALFAVSLLLARHRDLSAGAWKLAALLGAAYVAIVGATIWIAEQLSGAAIGGPTHKELIAHAVFVLTYPTIAGLIVIRCAASNRLG